jgi:hypothetical protein
MLNFVHSLTLMLSMLLAFTAGEFTVPFEVTAKFLLRPIDTCVAAL